jgi:hypothetical protein
MRTTSASTTSFVISMSEKKSRVEGRGSRKRRGGSPYRDPPAPSPELDDTEAKIGSVLAWALPLATAAGAIAVGLLASAGPALLVLRGGAILGAVMLLWGSVRTLTGDAPLTPALASASIRERATSAEERKTRVLRALKDLEHERDVGKIDAADYALLADQYRAEAKEVMREIDGSMGPRREKAEEIISVHLGKKGPRGQGAKEPREEGEAAAESRACPSCGVLNDEDAAFCKKCGEKLDAP